MVAVLVKNHLFVTVEKRECIQESHGLHKLPFPLRAHAQSDAPPFPLTPLLQPNAEGHDSEEEFVLRRNRSLRGKLCDCLLDPGSGSAFAGVHSTFSELLREGGANDLLHSASFWTLNGMRLWCKPTDRLELLGFRAADSKGRGVEGMV